MGGLRVIIGLLALAGGAAAADMPVKAPPPAATAYDWTGVYIGGHIGYAAGSSSWSAMPTGVVGPVQSGSLDLSNVGDVSACYQRALLRKPWLAGRLVMSFTIEESGRVGRVEIERTELPDVKLLACAQDAIRAFLYGG